MHKFTHGYLRHQQNRWRSEKKQTIVYSKNKCFLEIEIGGKPVGSIEFFLYFDDCPKTCENFRCLCTGEKGQGKTTKKPLHYKGTPIHRVVPGFVVQGGDFSRGNGCGGESIYGGTFPDENFIHKHTKPGLLSMANSGVNSNGSQFFVTLAPAPHLDGIHVVFGEVTSGIDILRVMEKLETTEGGRPKTSIRIKNCGMLRAEGEESDGDEEETEEQKKEREEREHAEEMKALKEDIHDAIRVGLASKHSGSTKRDRELQGAAAEPEDGAKQPEAKKLKKPHSTMLGVTGLEGTDSEDDSSEE
eukprot:TRINITY_DN55634_c0_g1_i1.p1 TRINITY_DN55634_c0_g1~~TRINITY_DN55634_c0_g1_i1.p1  ORF type:complete len:302 (-),score=34.89 TRINITY_DN55634_c0_g1_i1:253-1158(-)